MLKRGEEETFELVDNPIEGRHIFIQTAAGRLFQVIAPGKQIKFGNLITKLGEDGVIETTRLDDCISITYHDGIWELDDRTKGDISFPSCDDIRENPDKYGNLSPEVSKYNAIEISNFHKLVTGQNQVAAIINDRLELKSLVEKIEKILESRWVSKIDIYAEVVGGIEDLIKEYKGIKND